MTADGSGSTTLLAAENIDEVAILPSSRWHQAMPKLAFSVDSELGGKIGWRAEKVHPFAGVGKLFFALVIADLSHEYPNLLEESISVCQSHRRGAHTGPLRLHTGDARLTIDDALNLVLSSGDGASVLALLEFFEHGDIDLVERGWTLVEQAGLRSTTIRGTEDLDNSWGEGLEGTTTPMDLTVLLHWLCAPGAKHRSVDPRGGKSKNCQQVFSWMHRVFEPGGLASSLPGHGPNRVKHWTVSGWETVNAGAVEGSTSVLITQSPHAGWLYATAYHSAWGTEAGSLSARDVSAAFGTLGLSAYLSERV